MIEPYDDYPYAPEMVFFLGRAYEHYEEREDARQKVEDAIIALKRIGSVALRTKVQHLEESMLEKIKKEKDVHVVLEKKAELKRHYEESFGRVEKQLDEYINARIRHKKLRETEEKVLKIKGIQKRIEQAEFLIAKHKSKGDREAILLLEERIKNLKRELHKT